MKYKKTAWLLILIGVLLLMAPAILGNALVKEIEEINGIYSMNKAVVSEKNQLDSEGSNSFSKDDIKKISEQLKTDEISYMARSGLLSTLAVYEEKPFRVNLTGTNYLYDRFYRMQFLSGSYFTEKSEKEGSAVAVIDDELAWSMFKTQNAVGKTIELYSTPFKIIGIVRKDDSLPQRLTDDGIPDIYIPADKLLELDTTAKITAFEVKTEDTSTLDKNKDLIASALGQAGKNTANYIITDYNIEKALIEQMPLIVIFALGFLASLYLAGFVFNSVKNLIIDLKEQCKTDYFSNVVRLNAKFIVKRLILVLLVIIAVVMLYVLIKFKMYIPPRYIPEDLTNIKYFTDLFKSDIQTGLSNLGYVAPHIELLLKKTEMLMNWMFLASMLMGFILVYSGFARFRDHVPGVEKSTVLSSLAIFISIGISAWISVVFGLQFVINLNGILVLWTFIFIKILKNYYGKERVASNV